MFRDSPRLDVPRAPTPVRPPGARDISQPDGPTLNAPLLEYLTIDMSSENRPRIAPKIAACSKCARHLRDITLQLPAAFKRQALGLAAVSAELAPAAPQVHIEYCPSGRPHDYPFRLHKAHVE
ncbi:hypothetical protein AURDEDRAFT_175833 [Auricularia subglabra TFB-10046 SS5]|uniref:Uncharacterized protein n=1 Tax=Auricularia subglabra (strain TFB-10046 / SS5) TaxID=717982 RepID=J0WR17_AURST|nr:hypothetical protein AURDEDRAFT_175833 [Auricularia subglabra TFB-10046 SS5]